MWKRLDFTLWIALKTLWFNFAVVSILTKGPSQVKLIPILDCFGRPCLNYDCWVLNLWGSPLVHYQEKLMGKLMSRLIGRLNTARFAHYGPHVYL